MNFLKSIWHTEKLFIGILGISIILVIGQWFQADILFNRDDINSGQWWKVVSGNITHSNIPHLLLNLCGLWILGMLFIDSLKLKTLILSTLFLAFFVGIGLFLFTPELIRYYGFSGILYGLYFIAAINAILYVDIFTGVTVAILISWKIIWDYFMGGSQASAKLIGVPVANDAHLYGFIGAAVVATFLVCKWLLNSPKNPSPIL